jgi:hypothetical protein
LSWSKMLQKLIESGGCVHQLKGGAIVGRLLAKEVVQRKRQSEWQFRVDSKGCWQWLRVLSTRGYAMMSHKSKMSMAHRVFYSKLKMSISVKISDGSLCIDHLCRNRWCVNPAHMELVTPKENTLRGESFAAKNSRKTYCQRGHSYSGHNLIINKRGYRICRECARLSASRHYYSVRRPMEVGV